MFIEPDGSVTITPTVRATESDVRRIRAVSLGFARWRSVNERLLSGMLGRERGR
jgi:hypothetical protein